MSRTSKPPQDRRNEFIQAARDLFNEKGFEKTSIDDIVARLGVAKGLFYYYFDSKEEVLDILYERLQDEIESAVTGAMERKGLNAIERMAELLAAKRDVTCRSSTIMAYFKKERNKALQLSMEKRALDFMTEAMQEIIVQGVEEGVFDTKYPRQTAIAILSMAHGLGNALPETRTVEEMREYYQVLVFLAERVLGMKPGSFVVNDRLLPPGVV
ncbi:MAG: TetR/AcrR family transcriptional regulator [Methanomassiliicoccus sp.]|nr:TetR/AcrR family transcriptional regulator [Methanomassiliicoccus sp.]